MNEALHVLVVDDEEEVRKTVALMVRKAGHVADEAVDGKECLKKVSIRNYDLIFLDLVMPQLDGTQVLHAIGGRPNKPLIVVTSAQDDEEIIADVLHQGATAYLIKPLDLSLVRDVLNKVLEIRSVKDTAGGIQRLIDSQNIAQQ